MGAQIDLARTMKETNDARQRDAERVEQFFSQTVKRESELLKVSTSR